MFRLMTAQQSAPPDAQATETPRVAVKVVSEMHLPVVEITPELAKEWLTKNLRNRKLRKYKVDAYAAAMRAGEWRGTREPIEFADDGELLNGQHRLQAVVDSEVTIQNPVRFNVPRSELPIIDTGLGRMASDVLTMDGHKNSTQLAAAAKAYYLWHTGPSMSMLRAGSKKINNELVKHIVERHPDLNMSVEFAKHASKTLNLLPPSALAAIHYEIIRKHGRGKADEFFNKLIQGYDLHLGSPILALRNVLQKSANSQSRPTTEIRMAWTIHAFNKWIRGEGNVKIIKHMANQDFPQVYEQYN